MKLRIIQLVSVIFLLSFYGCAAAVYPTSVSTYPADEDAIKITSLHKEAIEEAQQLFNKERYREALAKFNYGMGLRENYPGKGTDLVWRGATYVKLGKYNEAIKDLTQAVPLQTDKTWENSAYHWLGRAHKRNGDFDKALENLNKAIKAKANLIEDYRERGYVYLQKEMIAKAKADARKMMEIDPRLSLFFDDDKNILGIFDFDKRKAVTAEAMEASARAESAGDFVEAFKQLERAYANSFKSLMLDSNYFLSFLRLYPKLSQKPELPEVSRRFFVKAQVFAQANKYDQAMVAYNNLISISPWYPDAWFNAAMIRAEQQNYKKAIDNMNTYLKLAPNAPDARAAQDKIYTWEALLEK